MILAAHRTAASGDLGAGINKRAFREKAEEIEKEPGFKRLLDRYMSDANFRKDINEKLSDPRATGMELEMQMQGPRLNRNPIPDIPAPTMMTSYSIAFPAHLRILLKTAERLRPCHR